MAVGTVHRTRGPPLAAGQERFYALGVDAFRIAAELLKKAATLDLDGVTVVHVARPCEGVASVARRLERSPDPLDPAQAYGAATVVLMLGAPLIVKIFFPQFADQAYVSHLAVEMLRILLPTVLLFSVSGVVIGVLYSYERFTMPAVVSIVWNLVIIAFIVAFSGPGKLGIYALVWGTFFGTVAQLLLLLPSLHRVDLRWRLSFDWRDPLLRRVLVLMVPVTITLGILNFNALVDFFFAQFVSDHAAAQINYAFRLYQLPQGMFAITIGTDKRKKRRYSGILRKPILNIYPPPESRCGSSGY